MGLFPYGSGKLFLQGGRAGQFTRVGIAALQEGMWDISVDVKELYGSKRYPVDVRTGKGKITGSAKYNDWRSDIIALILDQPVGLQYTEASTIPATPFQVTVSHGAQFLDTGSVSIAGVVAVKVGTGPTTGQYTVSAAGVYTFAAADTTKKVVITYTTTGVHNLQVNEDSTVPSTPFQITVVKSASFYRQLTVQMKTPGGSSTLGVGEFFTEVPAGGEIAGTYSVNTSTGVYTFATVDAAAVVRISYIYSLTTGRSVQWGNVDIGVTPVVRGVFQGIRDAAQMVLELENVVPHGMKTTSKVDDWMGLDSSMTAFADPDTDVIGQISLPQ